MMEVVKCRLLDLPLEDVEFLAQGQLLSVLDEALRLEDQPLAEAVTKELRQRDDENQQ